MNDAVTQPVGTWPAHLRPGAVRWARVSSRYEDTIGFYRDVVGLPVVGEFTGSFGEDGTIFGLPDTGTQMEVVRGPDGEDPGALDQLVLYLDDAEAVTGPDDRTTGHPRVVGDRSTSRPRRRTRSVARRGAALVGHLELVPTRRTGEVELKNMAVVRARAAETGYPGPVVIDGIPLRDRVWLSRVL